MTSTPADANGAAKDESQDVQILQCLDCGHEGVWATNEPCPKCKNECQGCASLRSAVTRLEAERDEVVERHTVMLTEMAARDAEITRLNLDRAGLAERIRNNTALLNSVAEILDGCTRYGNNPDREMVRVVWEAFTSWVRGISAIASAAGMAEAGGDNHRATLEAILNCAATTLNDDARILPCRVDEMTEREHGIFRVASLYCAAVMSIGEWAAKALDATPPLINESVTPAAAGGEE